MKVIVTVRHILVLGRSLRRNEGDCHCETYFSIRQDLVLGRSLRRNEGDYQYETCFSIRQESKEK
jgi:hypothetical protein